VFTLKDNKLTQFLVRTGIKMLRTIAVLTCLIVTVVICSKLKCL